MVPFRTRAEKTCTDMSVRPWRFKRRLAGEAPSLFPFCARAGPNGAPPGPSPVTPDVRVPTAESDEARESTATGAGPCGRERQGSGDGEGGAHGAEDRAAIARRRCYPSAIT